MRNAARMAAMTVAALALAGCGGGGSHSSDGGDVSNPSSEARLSQIESCDDLLTAIRADARAKIHVQAEELRARGWQYTGAGQPMPIPTFGPMPAPTSSPAGGPPTNATDTNTQVPDVDEADVVETDGARIYLLHGNALVILNASPPDATDIVDTVAIEGFPLGMFVADRRALVVSGIYDPGELGGSPQCIGIGAPFPTSPRFSHSFIPQFVPPCRSAFVKLTLLDLSGTPARVARELYVEGDYVSARRHGTHARVVVQRPWGVPVDITDPWSTLWSPAPPASEAELIARIDAWEQAAIAVIDESALAEWLPVQRERVNGALVERSLDCTRAFVPSPGETQQGTSLVVAFDMTTDAGPVEDTLLFGGTSGIYANGDTLVLTYPDWQVRSIDDASTRTAVHVFALPPDSLATIYRGSGFVPGTPLSQFALDVQGDVLRVATSFTSATRQQTVTRLTTTRIEDGALVTLGASPDLAPGEQFLGARFLDDRAYLVTFRRIDPLFVVDVHDPAHPTVVGEVELPGFSEYLHPLDAAHLLTIGRTTDVFGVSNGFALRIFDVGDPTDPQLTHEYVLAGGERSPAETDHLAFTFDTRLGLLALPINRYAPGSSQQSTLQLFDVDAHDGFALRGTIDHGVAFVTCPPPFDWEGCPVTTTMQRGLFIDDFVYSISDRQVRVNEVDKLTHTVATVPLP